MKTYKLILACAFVIAALAACKKSGPSYDSLQAGTSVSTNYAGYEKIPDRMFHLSAEQTLKVVKKFKGIDGIANTVQARLVDTDSLALDSSVFVLEAALNHGFDYNNSLDSCDFEVMEDDIYEFTMPIDKRNGKVYSNDLEMAYDELKLHIDSTIIDSVKVKVIDIEGFTISTTQVVYKAVIRKYIKLPVIYTCALITSTIHVHTSAPYAHQIIEKRLLNCYYKPCPIYYNWFYSNVQPQNSISNVTHAYSWLYYRPDAGFMTDDYVLSATQQNTYVTDIDTYIQSLKPLGYKVAAFSMSTGFVQFAPGTLHYKCYWILNWTYATANFYYC